MILSTAQLLCLSAAGERGGISGWDFGARTVMALRNRGLLLMGIDSRFYLTMPGRYRLEKAIARGVVARETRH